MQIYIYCREYLHAGMQATRRRQYVYGKLRLINAGLIFTVHPTPGDTYRGQCVVGLGQ